MSKLSCSTGIKGAIDGDLLLYVGSIGLRTLMASTAVLNLSASGSRAGKSRCLGKSPDETLVPTGAAPGPGPGPGPCPVSCDWSDLLDEADANESDRPAILKRIGDCSACR